MKSSSAVVRWRGDCAFALRRVQDLTNRFVVALLSLVNPACPLLPPDRFAVSYPRRYARSAVVISRHSTASIGAVVTVCSQPSTGVVTVSQFCRRRTSGAARRRWPQRRRRPLFLPVLEPATLFEFAPQSLNRSRLVVIADDNHPPRLEVDFPTFSPVVDIAFEGD